MLRMSTAQQITYFPGQIGGRRPGSYNCTLPLPPKVSSNEEVKYVMSATPQEVTQLLVAWSDGDRSALDELLPFS